MTDPKILLRSKLWIHTFLTLFFALLSEGFGVLTVFLVDSPEVEITRFDEILYQMIDWFPLAAISFILFGWIAYKLNREKAAFYFSLVPVIGFLILLGFTLLDFFWLW